MRQIYKISLRFFCLVIASMVLIIGRAQVSVADVNLAKQVVNSNRTLIGISADDIENSIVSSTYMSPDGIRMVYLQQSLKGIPVYNQMHVLAFRNGKLVSAAGERIPSIEKIANSPTGIPALTARGAVTASLIDSKIPASSLKAPIGEGTLNQRGALDFGKLGVTYENITAQLIWYPVNDKEVKLAWAVLVAPEKTDDAWLIKVDAQTGQILGKHNMTVYDSWDKSMSQVQQDYVTARVPVAQNNLQYYAPPIVNGASYLVIKWPAESPQHPGGTPSLHTDPWTWAPGNATSLKWHSDGTDYNITRGNNVWATEDRVGMNQNTGLPATSTTPDPLTFNFPPNFTLEPTTPTNQPFSITNLFYWNNFLHDIHYVYGFDEASGNFQTNNQGRGGAGNDNVSGLAQSGAGTNNANFLTLPDGQRGRMRMYLFTAPNPDRDGDLDNGVMCHEFGHGISNRLTGGPATAGSCLSNAEEGGEGWGDYYALMFTTNWATATLTDGALARPMGTYVLNQPVTGPGIRTRPYSTNMAINPLTYANMGVAPIGTEVHNIGEIWCMALWEMTWEIINQTGTINPNIFDRNAAGGIGGNSIALKLVLEGMRIQPCSPGFIDARNAILRADTLFFGGNYSCSIWKAFAKRGMGRGASQGSSNSATDQTPSFIVDNGVSNINGNVTAAAETQNIIYTNHLTAGVCSPMTNYFITDTLPTNVTYVSGGSYNAGNRTVTFNPITLNTNQSQDFPFTVTVNPGTYFPPVQHFNEQVTGATIPATWVINPATGNTWAVSSAQSHSGPNSFFAVNPAVLSDMTLANNASFTLNATASSYTTLTFWHSYNTEEGWDGGVVEISTNGGGTWQDLGSKIRIGKYNGSLGTGSALASRSAFTGNSGGFIQTIVDLHSYAGQNIRIRFRFASDGNTGGVGWFVDDIVLNTEAAVYMKMNLFNASSVIQSFTDTVTKILALPPSGFTFNSPAPATAACPAPATMAISLGTTSIGGFVNPITLSLVGTPPGTTTVSFAPNPVVPGNPVTVTLNGTNTLNNGSYVLNIQGTATGAPNQNVNLTYTINAGTPPNITNPPGNQTVCATSNASFTAAATGAITYKWQESTNGGGLYNDIINGGVYSNANTAILSLTGVTAGMNTFMYRCVITGQCGVSTTTGGTLTVNSPPAITGQPADVTICATANTSFTVTATGSGLTYQWQESTNGGGLYTDIVNGGVYSNAGTPTLNLAGVTAGMNTFRYRARVSGGGCGSTNSNGAILTVVTAVAITTNPTNSTVCAGANTSFTAAGSGAGIIYQWQFSIDGGGSWNNVPNTGVYSGAQTANLSITGALVTMNGYRYRAQLSNATCSSPGITTAAILTVNSLPAITTNPVNAIACVGGTATFTTAGTGTGIGYQWQESQNGGGIWNNITNTGVYGGATTATLTITGVTIGMNNFQYRVVITGTCAPTAVSTTALLTVIAPVAITTAPTNKGVCANDNTTFTAAATSVQTIIYQWQVSTDGGTTWNNVTNGGVYSGATTGTLTLTGATTAMNGYRYRVQVSSATCSTPVISGAGALTVHALPTVGLTAAPITSLVPGHTTTLTATPSAGTAGSSTVAVTWYQNGVFFQNTTNTYVVDVEKIGGYQVRVAETWTDGSVCNNQSTTVAIDATASPKLFIYPSPNNGTFTVSYYNTGGANTSRTVTIYDSKGSRVYTSKFTITGPYTLLHIDVVPTLTGIYYVIVGDASGKKMIDGKVIIH